MTVFIFSMFNDMYTIIYGPQHCVLVTCACSVRTCSSVVLHNTVYIMCACVSALALSYTDDHVRWVGGQPWLMAGAFHQSVADDEAQKRGGLCNAK